MDDHTNPTINDDSLFDSYFQWDIASAEPPNTMPTDVEIRTLESSILGGTLCENFPALANAESAIPRLETLADISSGGRSDCDNAAAGEDPTHRFKPKITDQRKSAEPDAAIPQIGMTENLDLEEARLGTNHDSVSAAAANSEESPEAVIQACKAALGKAESSEDGSVEAAFKGENHASAVVRPSSPHRSVCPSLRPSRDIHPINNSPSFTLAKQRHAKSLRPSRGIQPIMNQMLAVSIVVGTSNRPKTAAAQVIDSNAINT